MMDVVCGVCGRIVSTDPDGGSIRHESHGDHSFFYPAAPIEEAPIAPTGDGG